jgi:hypothetical protein
VTSARTSLRFAVKRMERESKTSIRVPKPVTFSATGLAPAAGWVVRLSVVGVVVEAPIVPQIGALVDLLVELREGPPVACRARVQWSRGGRFGAQFQLLGARQTYAIVEAMRAP